MNRNMASLKRSSVPEPASRKKPRFDDDEEEEEEPARPTEVAVPPTATIPEEDATAVARALLEACPPIIDDDIQTMRHINGKWFVQGDEKLEVVRLLRESNEINTLDRLDPMAPTQYQFKMLYRTFIRVFKISPVVFLSPLYNLRYGPRRSAKTCHAVFSSEFSKQMVPLLVHPVWRQNSALLQAALQFAVLCRVQPRHPWPLTDNTFGFLTFVRLRETCRAPDSMPTDIADMLRQAICSTPVAEELPAFLVSIADHVEHVPDKDIDVNGRTALPVNLKDLKSIEVALDNFAWRDASWRAGTKRIWDAVKAERGQNQAEYPKDHELKRSLEAGMGYFFQRVVNGRSEHARRSRQVGAGTVLYRPDPVVDNVVEAEPTVTEDNEPESTISLADIDMFDRDMELNHIDSPDGRVSELELGHSLDQDDDLVILASPNADHGDIWDSLNQVRLNPTLSTSLQRSNDPEGLEPKTTPTS